MKKAIDGLTKNILLMVGGFLACLSGNFFFGLLIGAGAGILHCCFGGATSHKTIKEAIKSSLPIAIVLGVLCGVGGLFSEGLRTIGGVLIGVVVTLMCGFIGSFIGNSRFYKEQTGDYKSPVAPQRQELDSAVQAVAANNNAPTQEAVSALANLRSRRNAKQDPEDYDEIITTVKPDGTEDPYYSVIKELTGKHVVTKRIIDEAYTKLPEDVKAKYINDPPLVALTSYAYSKQADAQNSVDSPFYKTVKQLSGMDVVNDKTIDIAYSNIPEEMRADLPKDQKSALMLFASGKTLSDIKSEADKEREARTQEKLREIEMYYNNIPAEQRSWLPPNKAKAVTMHKEGRFLPFMDTLPDELRCIPFYVWRSLAPADVDENNLNMWLLNHRSDLMGEFDLSLTPPLCHIPISALFELVPPHQRFGKTKREVVAGYASSFLNIFQDDLGEPLRRVPIKTMWLSLDPKERLHTNTKIKDILVNIEFLRKTFGDTGHQGDPLLLMLPTYLRDSTIMALYNKLPDDLKANNQISQAYTVLININRFKQDAETPKTTNAINCRFTDLIPAKFMRYMIEWGTDVYDDSLTDEQFCEKYYKNNIDHLINKNLPTPLNGIPLLMFKFLMPVTGSLNDTSKTEIAIINDIVDESSMMFTPMFRAGSKTSFFSYVPIEPRLIWEGQDPGDWSGIDDIPEDEVWRVWLPPSLRFKEYQELYEALPGIEKADNAEYYMLTHARELSKALLTDK